MRQSLNSEIEMTQVNNWLSFILFREFQSNLKRVKIRFGINENIEKMNNRTCKKDNLLKSGT